MESWNWKKEKALYQPGTAPVLLTIPRMRFLMVDGVGDPNENPAFQEAVQCLYAMSYGIKMLPKKNIIPPGYVEYSVLPLEGLWGVTDGRFSFTERDNWHWTVMIRQPEFVTPELFTRVQQMICTKKDAPPVGKVRLEEFEEGLCVQALHLGPYATEPETMERIHEFLLAEGYIETLSEGGMHHEIYLSDPRKSAPEKMKTILRHPVRKL